MIFGYARVSSIEQSLDGQVEALRAAGAEKIFAEKVSGKNTNGRPQFAKLLRAVSEGDVILVTKLDRFARSLRDLLTVMAELHERGVGFKSLGSFSPTGAGGGTTGSGVRGSTTCIPWIDVKRWMGSFGGILSVMVYFLVSITIRFVVIPACI
jgi:hypothetical protein